MADVTDALKRLEEDAVIQRIWSGDHTVWRNDPAEIENRLGWLHTDGDMKREVDALRTFGGNVRDGGFKDVVLLGMGGSSLGPEVIRASIGSADGFPELTVLDSTVPSWVRSVTSAIDPRRTLFIVSSKSGGTIESNVLYKHFRGVVAEAVGESAGDHFVAVTDPATPLASLAAADGFRRLFENRTDIGGRYSVLSHFGLVPAAAIGVDVARLLERANDMAARCDAALDVPSNPGAWLGAMLGSLALKGRDKLTIVASPSVASIGLWIEQLIAESTGKDGTGIVPVAGEPLGSPDQYGDDRVFVYLRVAGDDNAALDVATERLAGAGHPLVQLVLTDAYDIAAEFFRWEFATAVAGAILGIQPFDQPNVQAAKDATDRVLDGFRAAGTLPDAAPVSSAKELLAGAKPGDYLAVMAYVRQTPGVDAAAAALRKRVMERYKIATTFGYGPRFLHSTGQLHKGGKNNGLFLQLTCDGEDDVTIPGANFGFRTLVAAQALGDFEALGSAGRRVGRVDLSPDAEGGILRLLAEL
ncbi:MAG: glucose-6-phosphate isomerase [Chloroflexi bacterium]|nr:glucose-6-phosphate isomerase [Chloroflexota bacterium]